MSDFRADARSDQSWTLVLDPRTWEEPLQEDGAAYRGERKSRYSSQSGTPKIVSHRFAAMEISLGGAGVNGRPAIRRRRRLRPARAWASMADAGGRNTAKPNRALLPSAHHVSVLARHMVKEDVQQLPPDLLCFGRLAS